MGEGSHQRKRELIMKNKVTLFLKTIIFLVILLLCMVAVSLVVERKSSYDKNEMFMREAKENHIDALIFGSSHVINGINPIQLYDEYGYTSYNLGGYGSVLLSSYWQFRLALEYCTPKLVVVDAYMLENDIRYIDDPNANVDSDELHLNIDRFPLSKTKYEAINDMFSQQDKKYPYLMDYIIYHDRWKELVEDDFKRLNGTAKINHLMGAVMEYGVHSAGLNYTDFQAGSLGRETVGTTYLRRIIEDCQDRGIQVVVVTVPFLAMQENQEAAHTAAEIAAQYSVPYLNMLEVPEIIDYNTDMADAGHLNILGAEKVTTYLGDYIASVAELPDHRGDDEYAIWQQFSAEYREGIQGLVEGNEDLYSQLLMLQLAYGQKTFVISIRGASMSNADSVLIRSLKALGAGEALDIAVSEKKSYFMLCDNGQIYEYAGDSEEDNYIETSAGTFNYQPASDIYRVLYFNGDTENNLLYSDAQAYADVQVLFFADGQVTSHQYYTCDHFEYTYEQN